MTVEAATDPWAIDRRDTGQRVVDRCRLAVICVARDRRQN